MYLTIQQGGIILHAHMPNAGAPRFEKQTFALKEQLDKLVNLIGVRLLYGDCLGGAILISDAHN